MPRVVSSTTTASITTVVEEMVAAEVETVAVPQARSESQWQCSQCNMQLTILPSCSK